MKFRKLFYILTGIVFAVSASASLVEEYGDELMLYSELTFRTQLVRIIELTEYKNTHLGFGDSSGAISTGWLTVTIPVDLLALHYVRKISGGVGTVAQNRFVANPKMRAELAEIKKLIKQIKKANKTLTKYEKELIKHGIERLQGAEIQDLMQKFLKEKISNHIEDFERLAGKEGLNQSILAEGASASSAGGRSKYVNELKALIDADDLDVESRFQKIQEISKEFQNNAGSTVPKKVKLAKISNSRFAKSIEKVIINPIQNRISISPLNKDPIMKAVREFKRTVKSVQSTHKGIRNAEQIRIESKYLLSKAVQRLNSAKGSRTFSKKFLVRPSIGIMAAAPVLLGSAVLLTDTSDLILRFVNEDYMYLLLEESKNRIEEIELLLNIY